MLKYAVSHRARDHHAHTTSLIPTLCNPVKSPDVDRRQMNPDAMIHGRMTAYRTLNVAGEEESKSNAATNNLDHKTARVTPIIVRKVMPDDVMTKVRQP